jgi:hypothetical protein
LKVPRHAVANSVCFKEKATVGPILSAGAGAGIGIGAVATVILVWKVVDWVRSRGQKRQLKKEEKQTSTLSAASKTEGGSYFKAELHGESRYTSVRVLNTIPIELPANEPAAHELQGYHPVGLCELPAEDVLRENKRKEVIEEAEQQEISTLQI